MRYLLDTHMLLWWLENSSRLKAKFRKVIENPAHQIYVSSVTVWEICIKRSLNKLKAPSNLLEMIQRHQFDELVVKFQHAMFVEKLPNHHADPFDRLLIAQTLCENLIFLSEDTNVRKYDGLRLLR